MIPSSWTNRTIGSKKVEQHPLFHIGWYLTDHESSLDPEFLDELIKKLDEMYEEHFLDFDVDEPIPSEEERLRNQAHENVSKKLLEEERKMLQKQQKETLPILDQAGANVEVTGYLYAVKDADAVSKDVDKEYQRLKKLEEKKKPKKKATKKKKKADK
jgi:hypothetical protein